MLCSLYIHRLSDYYAFQVIEQVIRGYALYMRIGTCPIFLLYVSNHSGLFSNPCVLLFILFYIKCKYPWFTEIITITCILSICFQ